MERDIKLHSPPEDNYDKCIGDGSKDATPRYPPCRGIIPCVCNGAEIELFPIWMHQVLYNVDGNIILL